MILKVSFIHAQFGWGFFIGLEPRKSHRTVKSLFCFRFEVYVHSLLFKTKNLKLNLRESYKRSANLINSSNLHF